VNAIDINAAHQLLSFGVEDNGTVEFWDHRARSRVGLLRLPVSQLLSRGGSTATKDSVLLSNGVSVTAISSRTDGLSYAIGTSTGHTLLYDIRSPRPFATKDLGYGLPVKNVAWIEGGSRMASAAADGMVLSADKKVIKIWERNSVCTLLVPWSFINRLLRRSTANQELRVYHARVFNQRRTSYPRNWPSDACK
jgi:ribosome biogenesis protein ENP2